MTRTRSKIESIPLGKQRVMKHGKTKSAHPLLTLLQEELDRKNAHCNLSNGRCRNVSYCEPPGNPRFRLTRKTSIPCENHSAAASNLRKRLEYEDDENLEAVRDVPLSKALRGRDPVRLKEVAKKQARERSEKQERKRSQEQRKRSEEQRKRSEEQRKRSKEQRRRSEEQRKRSTEQPNDFSRILDTVTNLGFLDPSCEAIIAYDRDRMTTALRNGALVTLKEVKENYVGCPQVTPLQAVDALSEAIHRLVQQVLPSKIPGAYSVECDNMDPTSELTSLYVENDTIEGIRVRFQLVYDHISDGVEYDEDVVVEYVKKPGESFRLVDVTRSLGHEPDDVPDYITNAEAEHAIQVLTRMLTFQLDANRQPINKFIDGVAIITHGIYQIQTGVSVSFWRLLRFARATNREASHNDKTYLESLLRKHNFTASSSLSR